MSRIAFDVLDGRFSLGIELVPLDVLAVPSLDLALVLELTGCDAANVALAELLGAPLVTADRQLAAPYDRPELLALRRRRLPDPAFRVRS